MKKIISIFVILIIIFTLISCNINEEDPPDKTNNLEINKTIFPNELLGNENSLKPFKSGTYTNETFGFQLTFPESWDNYYVIYQYEEYIFICFFGESEEGQFEHYPGEVPGAPMFYIGTESRVQSLGGYACAVKKIGKVGETNFFYYTSTDYPISSLDPTNEYANKYSEDEKIKMKNDYQKAREMEKGIDAILETFKPIE